MRYAAACLLGCLVLVETALRCLMVLGCSLLLLGVPFIVLVEEQALIPALTPSLLAPLKALCA